MPKSPIFLAPRSLDEAVSQLERYGSEATLVAGSTAVTIMLRQGSLAPGALVSLGRIDELRGIDGDGDELSLGSLTTHRDVELSPVVRNKVPVLASTFGRVANVRVRNAATVGGIVAEADYAVDPPAVLAALNAEVDVVGPAGERSVPIRDFLLGFHETALELGEIVTRVRVPIPPRGTGSVYTKVMTRSSEDRPCIGVAAIVVLEPDGTTCADLRVSVGAAAETPQRLSRNEEDARGRVIDDELAGSVADRYAQEIDPLSDMRGSAWYRREMIRVWVRRAILVARRRAGLDGPP